MARRAVWCDGCKSDKIQESQFRSRFALDGKPHLRWNVQLMTKADLIEEVARITDVTRRDSEVIVETIFDSIVHSLRAGDKIEIRGFGSFRTRQRNSRVGRNPKTGDRVDVPAKKIPFFKPSKELKDLVNSESGGAPALTSDGHSSSSGPA